MKSLTVLLIACLVAHHATAEVIVATKTLRAQSLIGPDDVIQQPGDPQGALSDPAQAIGLETRVTIYAGRPILPDQLGRPAIVERNQILPLRFRSGGLSIQTEGRSLDRGGVGDTIRVMNLHSKTTLNATITADGSAEVLSP